MAAAFNLTAQINLRGPTNTRAIASQMRKQLSGIKVKVNLDIKGAAAKNVANINKQLQSLSRNAALANKNVTQLNQSIALLGAGLSGLGSGSIESIAKIQKQTASAGKSIDTATSQIQEFGKQSGLAIRRFAAFSAVTGVVYSLTNAVNSAYKEFVQFDRQLIRLSQVTGTSIAGLQGITNEITRLSTNLGVASTDLLQISVTLAQAGLSAQEAKTALEALAKSALAPSFDNLNDTVEGSIALMKQFSISSSELEASLGSVNAVAAAFAVEAGDIIKAIQRTGGVFASASQGVSQGTDALNEFVALFTSVRATTREGAETIATGLRTIFTRIQRGSTIEALKEYGVTLTDLEGKFVGPYEAIRRLSEGLQGLDPRDLRFGQIVEELGGFRQIGKVIPLIQQFSTAQKALAVAQGGQSSLSKAAIQAQASLAVQFEKTRQSFVALVRDIGNSTTFRTIASVSLTTANAFISLAGALKPLLPMLTALAAIKGASILSEFGSGFLGGLGKNSGGGGGATGGMPGGGGGGGGGGTGGGTGAGGAGRSDKDDYSDVILANTSAISANTDALTRQITTMSSNTDALSGLMKTMADLMATMQELNGTISNLNIDGGDPGLGLNKGGPVPRFASGGKVPGTGNRDTVEAMLTPGEYVIRKKAVEKIGVENLEQLNRGGRIKGYAGGGPIRAGLSSVKDIKIDDGDTFSATVTPNTEPFKASFRLWGYDAYETGGKDSRISSQRKKEIENLSGNEALEFPKSSVGFLIPSSARVDPGSRLTAKGAADQATNVLKSSLPSDSSKLAEAVNQTLDTDGAFGRYAINLGKIIPEKLTTGRYQRKNLGGFIQKFKDGGLAQRKVGYIDYDVIANPANEAVVTKGMEQTGVKGIRLYADHLTDLATRARKDSSISKLRAIYGVAGSGKTTLARGQGTDKGTLRETERFPILTPEDIQKATEVIVLSSSVSNKKLDEVFSQADRTYTLSSTTESDKLRVASQRASRDTTGVGLEGRKPGTTTKVEIDTAMGEALLSDRLGPRSIVLGRTESGKLRRKNPEELVQVIKKKIGFTWGGFSPMTAGHESIMDAAAAAGISAQDFIYLVGSNEGITNSNPSSYRTAIFDQDARVLLAKAGAGSRGATVLPKDKGFEVPQAFDIGTQDGRRQVVVPGKGSAVFVADKDEKSLGKYREAGYETKNLERTGGISGTQVRDLIMSGDMGQLQQVLSPNVYELISNNIKQIRNRANVLPEIIAEVKKRETVSLSEIESQIKALGISRIDNKKVASDPEYAAQVDVLKELRKKRDKIKSFASFEPYSILAQMAAAEPEQYGLDLSTPSPSVKPMRQMGKKTQKANLGGFIQKFIDGGWVERMKTQSPEDAESTLKVLNASMEMFAIGKRKVPNQTFDPAQPWEDIGAREVKQRIVAIKDYLQEKKLEARKKFASRKGAGLKPTDKYNEQEMLDAITLYQAGSGPFTTSLASGKKTFKDREETYQTSDVRDRLLAASQFNIPKNTYSGLGRSQLKEILKDTGITAQKLTSKTSESLKALVGKRINFPTFLSTSVSKSVAESFVQNPGALLNIDGSSASQKTIDVIQAKNKTKVSAKAAKSSRRLSGLDKISDKKIADYDDEKEFIIPPNTTFQIIKATGKVDEFFAKALKNKPTEEDKFIEFFMDENDEDFEKTRLDLKAKMLNSGGKVQQFKKGGEVFGTGETKFPRRISNAYAKKLEQDLNAAQFMKNVTAIPTDERIFIDEPSVASTMDQPFDRSKFLQSFTGKVQRDSLFQSIGNFAKFIGLPQEDLATALPTQIDFGNSSMRGRKVIDGGLFSVDPLGSRGEEGWGLSSFGYTEKDEQDLFGYEKLIEEKKKLSKKILKTPIRTFEDGSFTYDSDAFNANFDEMQTLQAKVVDIKGKQSKAIEAARAVKKQQMSETGRGNISLGTTWAKPSQDVLYHELTHQLINGLRTRSAESFEKYKQRVEALFNTDNNGLADAFDALSEGTSAGYSSADVVYGRKYKQSLLESSQIENIRMRDNPDKYNPELLQQLASDIQASNKARKAREYRPINPSINKTLLAAGYGQDHITKTEDNGKEEFLTTLVQKAPILNTTLQDVLDSTLSEFLGNAGIQRQKFATGGLVPGAGNRDTVPAMLTPGEFVIRKKAVETIGAGNLARMNKYASGGLVQRFTEGADVEDIKVAKTGKINKSDIDRLTEQQAAALLENPNVQRNFATVAALQKRIGQRQAITKEQQELAGAQEYGLVGLYGSPRDVPEKTADGATVKLVGRTLDQTLSDEYEKMMIDGFEQTISKVGANMASRVGASTVSLDRNQMNKAGLYNAIGAYLEAAIATLGAPYDKDEIDDPIDFAQGLGKAAALFGIPSDIPTDTTRTVFGKGKSPKDFLGQVNRYRSQTQRFAQGGSAEDTVPALLTPGEFVINKEAAKKLGSEKLNKLNKADRIQGFNKGGAVGFVQRFAGGGSVEDDKAAYVARMAQKLGMTVEKYEKMIRARIIDTAGERANQMTTDQASLVDVIVKNIESIGDADIEDVVRTQVQDLLERMHGGADQVDPDLLSEGIDDLVDMMKNGLSIDQIKAKSDEWSGILDTQIEAADLAVEAQEKMAKELGFLTERMKTKDIDFRAQKSLSEGKFGAFDKMDLRGAQRSIESGFGKIFDDIGTKFSTANLPGMARLSSSFPAVADKITMIGDKMGGLTGILGTGSTLLAAKLPQMVHAFDQMAGTVSDHSEAVAGITGALQSAGSFGLSGAVLGQQAFGKRGAAVGGAIGLAGGAVSGFIKESTAKEVENAMRGVTAASSNLDKTMSRLNTAQTIEERQELVQQLNREYDALNQALNNSAQEIEKNRIWNALSSGLEGFMNSLSTVIGFMAAARMTQSARGVPMPTGRGRRRRRGMNTGGLVPVKLASGEGVFTPPLPTSVSNLKKMNRADSNGYRPDFPMGGMGIVPGDKPPTVDHYETMLPENSFVVRAKAMDTLQAATGGRITSGSVSAKGYAGGGNIVRRGYAGGGDIGVRGYFAGGLVARALMLGFRTIGPTLTKGLFRGLKTMAPYLGIEIAGGITSAIGGFFDNTAQDQQLAAQVASLEQLRKLVDIQSGFVATDQKSSQRLLSRMDPVEQANLTSEQRRREYARMRTSSGEFNELNIMGERQARSKLGGAGFVMSEDQSVQEYLDTLSGDDRKKAEELVEEANKELAKRIYLEARQREGADLSTAKKEFENQDPENQAKVQKYINEELGAQNRRIALSRRMMVVNRQLQKFTLSLTDVMNRLGSTMDRVASEIVASTNRISQISGEFAGEGARSAAPEENMVRTLSNITAYSSQELGSVVDSINQSLGNTQETRQMGDLVKGLQVMQKELPLILRDTADTADINAGAESNIRSRLDEMFAGVAIGSNVKRDLQDSIMNYITDKTGNRQGMSYEDLANNIKGLKELDAAAEKARSTFEEYAKKQTEINRQLGGISDQLSNQLDKLKDNVIKVRDIQLQSALQLSEQFNKTLSLGDLNAPFMNSVSGLTGGTTDAAKIGGMIAEAIAQKRALEADPNTQTSALGSGQIAKLTSKINRYQRALDILATSTDRASNALKKIDEQQRISAGRRSGVMDFLANVNNPEALMQMRQEQVSYSNVMAGTGTVNDIAQGIASLRMVESTQTPEQFARTQEAFFNNAMTILENAGGNPAIMQQFRDAFAADFAPQDQNPAIQPFVDAYKEAANQQILAAQEQSKLVRSGAEIAADALRKGADDFTTRMQAAVSNIVAELNGVANRLGLGGPANAGGMATGGVVYASAGQMINFQPRGTDTVPAMLTPGEFVVNRAATSKNLPLLKSINSGGYSRGGRVSYYDKGGYVSTSGGKFTKGQEKLDEALETDFEKVIKNIVSKEELDMVDTGYYQVQKNFLPGSRTIRGKMTYVQSAMDFFKDLDRGLKSTDAGGDFRSIEKLDVFKETSDRITNKDLRSILAKDNRLVSVINPYLKAGRENSWWSFFEGWGTENKKYQGNLMDASSTIETLGPKLDAYSDIMASRISKLPELKKIASDKQTDGRGRANARTSGARRQIPKLQELQNRKNIIDGLIDLRAFGSGIEDVQSIQSLYGGETSGGYSNDITTLIKTGLLPEEILDKGFEEGLRKGVRNAAIGLAVGATVAAAPFTGGASLGATTLLVGGTMGGAIGGIALANYIEERNFQKLKSTNPLTYDKIKALKDNENFKSTASTWEGLIDIADVAVSAGPGVLKFLSTRGSKLMRGAGKSGALGVVDDAVNPASKRVLDDLQEAASPASGSRRRPKRPSRRPPSLGDDFRLTDDTLSMLKRMESQVGPDLSRSFDEFAADALPQKVRNAFGLMGVSPEDFYKVAPDNIRVNSNTIKKNALGVYQSNRGKLNNLGNIEIQNAVAANTLYHEMTHSMLDYVRKQRTPAWERYQNLVKQAFDGDDPYNLTEAIEQLSSNYKAPDMLYGRYYKVRQLDDLLKGNKVRQFKTKYPELAPVIGNPGNFRNLRYDQATDAIMNRALKELGVNDAGLKWNGQAGMEEFLTKLMDNANQLDNTQRAGLNNILDDLLSKPPPPGGMVRDDSILRSLNTDDPLTLARKTWERFTKPIRERFTRNRGGAARGPLPPTPRNRTPLQKAMDMVMSPGGVATGIAAEIALSSVGGPSLSSLLPGGTPPTAPNRPSGSGSGGGSGASGGAGAGTGGSASSSGVQDAIEQHIEHTKRVFQQTNAPLLDATGGDGIGQDSNRYSFGQVQLASNMGLMDPLRVVDYYARSITIPEFELGGTSQDGGVAPGNLLTEQQRKVYEDQYNEVMSKIKTLYTQAQPGFPRAEALFNLTDERDLLKEVLESDYRAQFNLGIPTKEPKFNLTPPTSPTSTPPNATEKAMLADSVPKDNKQLQEWMSILESGTTTKTNREIIGPFKSRFENLQKMVDESRKPGVSNSYQKNTVNQFNKLKKDYLAAFSVDGVDSNPIKIGSTFTAPSGQTTQYGTVKPEQMKTLYEQFGLLKTDHSTNLKTDGFLDQRGGLAITDQEKEKVNEDINKMIARYRSSSRVTNKEQLKAYLQNETAKRDQLRTKHAEWDSFYKKEKDYHKKQAEFEFLKKRWTFRDELRNDPEQRITASGQPGMGSLDYILFNHPKAPGAVNPFSKFDEEILYGQSGKDVKNIMEPFTQTTNKTIEKLLTNYAQALGINRNLPLPKTESDMNSWIKNIDPTKVQVLDSDTPDPGWMLDTLKNMYTLGMDPSGDTIASKFGLWSVTGAQSAFNKNFGKQYEEKFLNRSRKEIERVSKQKGSEAEKMPADKVESWHLIAEALEEYTAQMNRGIYKRANPGFAPLNFPDFGPQAGTEAERVKKYRNAINSQLPKFIKDNFDYEFGGITSSDGFDKVARRLGIPLPGDQLRETVLTDRNSIKRIKEGKTYAVERAIAGEGTAGAKEVAGIANLFAAAGNAQVAEGDQRRFTDLDGNPEQRKTILGLLASALDFRQRLGVTDRQSRLDYVHDFDFSSLLRDPVYAQYETNNLDPSIKSLKPVYKLWDSLKNYFVKDGKTTARFIDDKSFGMVSQTKTVGDQFEIAGNKINAGNFLASYKAALSTGEAPYRQILEGASILADTAAKGGAGAKEFRESGLIGAPTPFGNDQFILSQKNIQFQDPNDPNSVKSPINRAKGGSIPNYLSGGGSTLVNYQPKGTDTVPAMLTPGEFVVNRAATQKHLPLLKSINNGSMPTHMGGATYARSGGVIQARNYFDGGLGSMGRMVGGALGFDMSGVESVFDTFIRNFNSETSAFGGLINNLARVFPALGGPVNNFGNHVDKLVNALNGLKNIEIKGPNIPDTITVNSDTIRVELIAPQDSNYKLSDEDKRQIAEALQTKLQALTTLGRIA